MEYNYIQKSDEELAERAEVLRDVLRYKHSPEQIDHLVHELGCIAFEQVMRQQESVNT